MTIKTLIKAIESLEKTLIETRTFLKAKATNAKDIKENKPYFEVGWWIRNPHALYEPRVMKITEIDANGRVLHGRDLRKNYRSWPARECTIWQPEDGEEIRVCFEGRISWQFGIYRNLDLACVVLERKGNLYRYDGETVVKWEPLLQCTEMPKLSKFRVDDPVMYLNQPGQIIDVYFDNEQIKYKVQCWSMTGKYWVTVYEKDLEEWKPRSGNMLRVTWKDGFILKGSYKPVPQPDKNFWLDLGPGREVFCKFNEIATIQPVFGWEEDKENVK
jgi:hypothetical protein